LGEARHFKGAGKKAGKGHCKGVNRITPVEGKKSLLEELSSFNVKSNERIYAGS